MHGKDQQQNIFTIEHVHEQFKMRQARESEIVHFFLFLVWMVGIAIFFILEILADPGILLALWWVPVFGGLGSWLERYHLKKDLEQIISNDKKDKTNE